MIAHLPATTSRPPRELSESNDGGGESRPLGWAVRLARICLAIYLIPVLLVMFLVGAVGVVVLGVAGGAVKLAALIGGALETRGNDFPR